MFLNSKAQGSFRRRGRKLTSEPFNKTTDQKAIEEYSNPEELAEILSKGEKPAPGIVCASGLCANCGTKVCPYEYSAPREGYCSEFSLRLPEDEDIAVQRENVEEQIVHFLTEAKERAA